MIRFFKTPFKIIVLIIFCLKIQNCSSLGDNFPSLLSRNATIAIVLDKDYLGTNYEIIKSEMEKYFVYAKREILKHGGVNIQYYSWTQINIRKDFTAILNIGPCDDMWKLYREAQEENILFLAITDSDCPRLPQNQAISVPLISNGEELPQVLVDLRSSKAYNWKSAILLYDETLERDMVTRVVISLTGHTSLADVTAAGMAITFIAMESKLTDIERKEMARNVLANLPLKQLGQNFLVIASQVYIYSIMEVAKELGLVHPMSQWIYAISDTNGDDEVVKTFSTLIKEGDNVAFVYNYTTLTKCSTGILCHSEELLDAFCTALDGAIQEEVSMAAQVFDEEWEAIRPTKSERKDFLLRDIKNHLSEFGMCNNCTRWKFSAADVWGKSFTQTYQTELITVGHWRPTDGPTFSDVLFPHVVHGFRGRNLPIVTQHNPPWQIISRNESGGITEYKGLVFDILKEVAKSLNFTYTVEVIPYEDGRKSINESNAIEVTGFVTQNIVDILRTQQAFLAACAFTVEGTEKFINFTTPISVQSHTFLVARPQELSRALLFINPFTGQAWLCLAVSIILVGPILYWINWLSPVYEAKGSVIKGLNSVQSCMWYIYGALLQQGGMYLPEADSSRLIVGTWWLMVLVVVTTYCGNLVAFLTFPKIDIPIKTLNELIEHRETISWSTQKGTLLEYYLKTAHEYKYKAIHEKNILVDDITPELSQQIRDRKHVFIGWKSKLAYIMKKQYLQTGACDYAFGSDEFLDEQIALVLPENSPYLPMINEEIFRLHQVGLIEKWMRAYLPKRDRCWKVGQLTEINNHTVTLDDMQGSFFVLFLGFVISFIWIALEKLYNRWKVKKDKKLIKPFMT